LAVLIAVLLREQGGDQLLKRKQLLAGDSLEVEKTVYNHFLYGSRVVVVYQVDQLDQDQGFVFVELLLFDVDAAVEGLNRH